MKRRRRIRSLDTLRVLRRGRKFWRPMLDSLLGGPGGWPGYGKEFARTWRDRRAV